MTQLAFQTEPETRNPETPDCRAAEAAQPFSDEELRQLHVEDKLAGTAIVAIMIAIFTLGLLGYVAIALVCALG
jgi:hypothetical protein